LDDKDLFMSDNAGNPKFIRQFPIPFDSNGELDRAHMHQEHSDSIHGQHVRSYWGKWLLPRFSLSMRRYERVRIYTGELHT
jgi:hypothetical protein